MKKQLLLVAALSGCVCVFGQKWVPKFGVTMQPSAYGNKNWHDLNYGYFFGVGRNFKLTESLSLRTEVLFNSNVRSVAYTDFYTRSPVSSIFQRRNYVSVPILIRKTFNGRNVDWFVEGGFYLGLQVGGAGRNGTYSSAGWSYETYKIRHCNVASLAPANGYFYYPNQFHGGALLGVGAVIKNKIEIELRYGSGIANKGLQLSIGIPLKH